MRSFVHLKKNKEQSRRDRLLCFMMANMSLAEGQLQEMSKMISDCHMHTNFSPDADRGATPEVMIKGALEKGLKRICFTL